jgi:hypothetical protein
MAATDTWTCQRCLSVNPAGIDACAACGAAANPGARRQADAVAALPPSPSASESVGWITRESALLVPEIFLAGALLVACPLWFVFLLRHGQYVGATVLFVGIAPAMLLAVVAVRQKSAGGLYLTSWVTFVAMTIAALVERVTQ